MRFHKASKNIVRNNVFVCSQDIPPIRYNRTEESDIQKIANIILQQNISNDWKKLNDIIENRKDEFGPTKQF
jgi:hypothetical protein